MLTVVSISILGLFVGSFLSVIIFRFPDLKSITMGRSACPKCRKKINNYDLIPLVSYIVLLGKCRNCREKISIIYPVIELFTGTLFLLLALSINGAAMLVPYLVLGALSVIIFFYDAKYLEIPEIFLWLLLLISIIIPIFSGNSINDVLFGGLIGGGILGIMVGISNEKWMGSGDIFIGLAYGLLLGIQKSILFLFLAFVIGALYGIILIAIKGKNIKSEVPFAPFLIIAGVIAIVWGGKLVNFYLNFAII